MTTFTNNLLFAIAKSLQPDANPDKIELQMRGEDLQLQLDGQQVVLNAGRAQKIVGNVLRGLLSSLHGAESGKEFAFLYEREQE